MKVYLVLNINSLTFHNPYSLSLTEAEHTEELLSFAELGSIAELINLMKATDENLYGAECE